MYPLIEADLDRLRGNARFLRDACRGAGIHMSVVTKVVCARRQIVEALLPYADSLADSRLLNLAALPEGRERLLLRLADPNQAEEVVRLSNVSLQSEQVTIEALGRAAQKLRRRHRIILMVDLGDLREGLMADDRAQILRAARAAAGQAWLELAGVGTNLTCFGGILPDGDNLGRLLDIAGWLRAELKLPLPLVSGGNSSSLGLLLRGEVPRGINHLRLGESLMLGRDTATGEAVPGLRQDAFTLKAVLGEVQDKPSKPIGRCGPNAFGEHVSFPDLGPMRRGIALVGRQDTDAEGLRPRDPDIRVLGASSDHLILDLTRASGYGPGSVVEFDLTYGALLKAYTSPYVDKAFVG